MNNGRKKRVVLSNNQRKEVKLEFIKRLKEKGIVNNLASEFKVSRKVISETINSVKKLQYQEKVTKKKTRELKEETDRAIITQKILDTVQERVNLIKLLKASQIVPIAKKVKANKTLTIEEKIDLQQAIRTLETLFKGIDDINKVDIHFHSTKILNVIQNLDEETAKIMFPDLKNMLCNTCPAYIKYGKEV